ncbi:hypothetical protein BEWA_002150 [Theileria equi strain WA]|uniref:Uncharacterized protein n=1 Tax=Theileria equi strain WA TaxID=1537102 RepID=L0AZX1_THEEQ|nr:hypothetical protein BEWA_002150 [Theileria equi strain WA]AFZ80808.1 hypothetical protein BEWA_002150 [Theileria equi strain WA]|eukprot:XP_004830474.1 hypothetical protein BEWA_002150 [Theileria equi strain WA]
MSGRDTLTLNLDINGKCDGICKCGLDRSNGMNTKKATDIRGVTNFTEYTHRLQNGTFTLNGDLGGGHKIRVGGIIRSSIENVTEVSVYYWNGNDSIPILLGITKVSDTPEYYSYWGNGGGLGNWNNRLTSDKSLEYLLDDQNCRRNHAIPFNITSSQSGDLPQNSNCIKDYRRIDPTRSLNPPGSNYISKAYMTTGLHGSTLSTMISRVTYNNQPTDIPHISDPIDVITLYSYPGSDSVPLMIEFKPNVGDSKWFYSTNLDEKNWMEHGDGSRFYDEGTTPLPALSAKLDEVLCKQHNNVTLNLTKSNSRNLAEKASSGKDNKYCCDEHKKDSGRISVTEGNIKVNGVSKTTSYYKHSLVPGTPVAGIYYKDSGSSDRKKITFSGVFFPIGGVRSVYTFYCGKDDPLLIYVDSPTNGAARGWYKKDSDGTPWKWIGGIHSITESHLKSVLSCDNWRKLRIVLRQAGCSGLPDCLESSKLDEQLEQEMQEEEKIAGAEREKEIAKVPSAELEGPDGNNGGGGEGALPKGADAKSPDGSKETSVVKDAVGKPRDIQHESPGNEDAKTTKGSQSVQNGPASDGLRGPNVPPITPGQGPPGPPSEKGRAEEVTIKLDSRHSYDRNLNSGETIYIAPYTGTHIKGYDAYEHTYDGKFIVRDLTVGGKKQIFLPGVTSAQDLKKVVVYFFVCGSSSIPLLVYVGTGKKDHKWYENRGQDIWIDISDSLKNKPPSEALIYTLRTTLKGIKQTLGVSCERKTKKLVIQDYSNDLPDSTIHRLQNNNVVRPHISTTIPPLSMPRANQRVTQNLHDINDVIAIPGGTDDLSVSYTEQAATSNIQSGGGETGERDSATGSAEVGPASPFPGALSSSGPGGLTPGGGRGADQGADSTGDPAEEATSPGPQTTTTTTEDTEDPLVASDALPDGLTAGPGPVPPRGPQGAGGDPSAESSPPHTPPGPEALGAESVGITAILTGAGTYGGPLAGAGGLTGLCWWAFKRSRGDPWSNLLRVYVRTIDKELIEVSPSLQVPKSLDQFELILRDLKINRKVRSQNSSTILIKFVKNEMENILPPGSKNIGLSNTGTCVKLEDYLTKFKNVTLPLVFHVGAISTSQAHGTINDVEEIISISPHGLTAAHCCAKICNELVVLYCIFYYYKGLLLTMA